MNNLVIYESKSGTYEVRIEGESTWLNQEQISSLFGRDRSVVNRHIRNIFSEGELHEESIVQNLHNVFSDKAVKFYNLDVIISVGYRVKSMEGARFRQWASAIPT